jgi:peptidoglycan hydrolase-like protein with peptidoglycan-binding domain
MSRRISRSWLVAIVAVAAAIPLSGFANAHRATAAGANRGTTIRTSRATATRTGDEARQVQQRLVALRYLPPDAVTGRWDYRTSQAIMAFQAWEGLGRDGVVGPRTRAKLQTASAPSPRATGSGRVIEVYRATGVTLLVDGPRLVRAIHSSSGRTGFQTPTGTYRVFRKDRNAWSFSYHVWLPYASFFNRGIALHASPTVPAGPASHGCIRISAPEGSVRLRVRGDGHAGGGLLMRATLGPRDLEPRFSPLPLRAPATREDLDTVRAELAELRSETVELRRRLKRLEQTVTTRPSPTDDHA